MNKKWQMRKPIKSVAFKLSHNNYCMITTLLFYIQIPCNFFLFSYFFSWNSSRLAISVVNLTSCVHYLVNDFCFYIAFECWSQAAIAVQSNTVHELKEKAPVPAAIQVGQRFFSLFVLLTIFMIDRYSVVMITVLPYNDFTSVLLIPSIIFLHNQPNVKVYHVQNKIFEN